MNSHAQSIRLSDEQAARIGAKIWQSQSGHTIAGLTAWNIGEEFASLALDILSGIQRVEGDCSKRVFHRSCGFLQPTGSRFRIG
jgi:hypothetical protein